MQKNRARIVFVVLLLLVCMFTSSCALPQVNRAGTSDMFSENISYENTAEIKKLTAKGEILACSSDLAYFVNEENGKEVYSVYNLTTNTLVASYDTAKKFVPMCTAFLTGYYNGNLYFYVKDDTSYICDAKGTTIFSSDNTADDVLSVYSGEYFYFDGRIYKFTGNDGASQTDISLLQPIRAFDYTDGNLGYVVTASSATVYNEKFVPICSYNVPSYAAESNIFILENGNLLSQYSVNVPDGEDYDIVSANTKKKLYWELITVNQNKTESVKMNAYILTIDNRLTFKDKTDIYADDIQNFAKCVRIKDKRFDETGYEFLIIRNSLSTISCFKNTSFDRIYDFYPLSNDRVMVKLEDTSYITDYGFNIICNATNAKYVINKYIATDTAIFDTNGNKITDTAPLGYTLLARVGENLLYSKKADEIDEYYIYDGTFIKLPECTDLTVICDTVLELICPDGKNRYIGSDGKALFDTEGVKAEITDTGDVSRKLMRTSDGYYVIELNKVIADIVDR